MGQKDGEKWTAAVDLQPTIHKSDRLLDVKWRSDIRESGNVRRNARQQPTCSPVYRCPSSCRTYWLGIDAEFEQLLGVGAANFYPIRFTDTGRVEPVRRMVHILERPVG